MFNLLKSKLKDLTNKLTNKAEKKEVKEDAEVLEEEPLEEEEIEEPEEEEVEEESSDEKDIPEEQKDEPEEDTPEQKPEEIKEQPIEEADKTSEPQIEPDPVQEPQQTKPEPIKEIPKPKPTPQPKETPKPKVEPVKEEPKKKIGLSLISSLRQKILGKFTISKKDIDEYLDDFELSLLEADINIETSEKIIELIKDRLIGKEIKSRDQVSTAIINEIKEILIEVMKTENLKLDYFVEQTLQQKKPVVLMFIGPNGAGKTTTIAKLAKRFSDKGKKIVFASADTFRAGSIEQLEVHGERLGIKVVKHDYKADPTAVAYDAVASAKSKGMDIVMIDTAGRQETNVNLVRELEKLVRKIQPDLKIYIGESVSGHNLLNQMQSFIDEIGVDAFILTKLDTDTKGGTAISVLHTTKKPLLFLGTGQKYEDLIEFTPNYIIDKLFE